MRTRVDWSLAEFDVDTIVRAVPAATRVRDQTEAFTSEPIIFQRKLLLIQKQRTGSGLARAMSSASVSCGEGPVSAGRLHL